MISINTEQGTFEVPGTAADIDASSGLTILKQGTPIAEFRRWNHWIEIPDTTTKD